MKNILVQSILYLHTTYLNMEEVDICKFWEENNVFKEQLNQSKNKETYHFYDGPPFMTGLPHYGHILAGFIKDTVTRHFCSNGYHVPRISGIDCIGEGTLINLSDGTSIPIENFNNFNASVETYDIEKKGLIYEKKTNFIKKGIKKCIELKFMDETKLTCTPDHKIYTNKG